MQRDGSADGSRRCVSRGVLSPVTGRKIGRVNAKQVDCRFVLILCAADANRVTVNRPRDDYRLPIESPQIAAGVSKHASVIENDREKEK